MPVPLCVGIAEAMALLSGPAGDVERQRVQELRDKFIHFLAAEIDERNSELEDLMKIDTDALRARKAELESELQDQRDELKTIKDLIDVAGVRTPAAKALSDAGLEPLILGPKEGLALLNGTQFSTANALAD